jgi:WD40 repeat protein
VGEKTPEDYGGVFAAPRPRRTLRRILAWAMVPVLVLTAAIVVYRHATAPMSLIAPGGGSVRALGFSPDGRTLAVSDGNGCTYLQDANTGHAVKLMCGIYASPLAFSQDGKWLAVAGGDDENRIGLWNVATRHQVAAMTNPDGGTEEQGVSQFAFSPDGRTLAAGDNDGRTFLWDTATGRLIATLPDPHTMGVNSIAFSPDGTTLAAGDVNDTTYIWDVRTKDLAARLTGPAHDVGIGVISVAFSPKGRTLAVADGDDDVYLWDVPAATLSATLSGPLNTGFGQEGDDYDVAGVAGDGRILSVAFSPDGSAVVAAGPEFADNAIYLWAVASRRITATLIDPGSQGVNSVAFSPDGRTLAAADTNGHTYLWHLR